MTKLEFMKELEGLLSDIPLDEKVEAIQYYNDYFEDAGVEHEEEIILELGSPSKVAAMIKADLNANSTERESRGYFTENGYQDTMVNDEKYELRNTNSETKQSSTSASRGILILIAILTIPVWFPLIISIFGVAISILATGLALLFAFGLAGVCMIGAGVILFVAGLLQLAVPFIAMLMIGGGLIVFGLGMLFTLGCFMICKHLIPAIFRGIVDLCRLPFRNRGVMA